MGQAKLDIVVLAGGRAARMGALCAAIPKALLPVSGVPFVVWQMQELARKTPDLARIFFVVKGAEAPIFAELKTLLPVPSHLIAEESPMGTGGAILHALSQKKVWQLSDPFLVINGDVLFPMTTHQLIAAADDHGAALQCIDVDDTARYGRLKIEDGKVVTFEEKKHSSGAGVINTGLYAFRHNTLKWFRVKPCSFEMDIAPVLAKKGRLAAVRTFGDFTDIGTPESYAGINGFLARHRSFQS